MSGEEQRLVLTAGPVRSQWLYGYDEDERKRIADTLLDQSGYQVFQLYMWDRPAGDGDFPLTYMTVAFQGQVGAAHFYDHYAADTRDAAVVTVSADVIPTSHPLMYRPESGIPFPPNAIISRDRLRQLVMEFVTTGVRPASAKWQSVEFV